MSETEIKLRVAPAALPGVQRAMARGRCRTTPLVAAYFDTPGSALAQAGWALRLRREGTQWVQTAKGPAGPDLARPEFERPRGRGRARPALDLSMLSMLSTPQGTGEVALLDRLADDARGLAPIFEVDVRRVHRLVRHRGALVELALDVGEIRCGARREPICELELELKAGTVEALCELAARWSARHGLWLDPRSKSERGYALRRVGDGGAEAAEAAAAAPADSPPSPSTISTIWALTPEMNTQRTLRACLANGLDGLCRGVAMLAAGEGDAETLHQVRVGLRRALSLLRSFAPFVPAVDAAWLDAGRELFGRLGAARDRDVLQAWLLPALQAAGSPPLRLFDMPCVDEPAEVARSAALTGWLLSVLGFVHASAREALPLPDGDAAAAEKPAGALQQLRPLLARWHRRLRRAGQRADALSDAQCHRARRRLKRLRYVLDALAPLFASKAARRYLQRLRDAQQALGEFNDLCVAQSLLAAAVPANMAADDMAGHWFARGWLAAEHPQLKARAAAALRALGRTPAFLR